MRGCRPSASIDAPEGHAAGAGLHEGTQFIDDSRVIARVGIEVDERAHGHCDTHATLLRAGREGGKRIDEFGVVGVAPARAVERIVFGCVDVEPEAGDTEAQRQGARQGQQ